MDCLAVPARLRDWAWYHSEVAMRTILWWIGLPVRLLVIAVVFSVLAIILPFDLDEAKHLAREIYKAGAP